ncbi:MAG: DUF3617 domain-containing protein [Alcanivorax sp.]|nr:DUF3617 domain-containing protein [Alcanivorax sp.]
MLAPGLLALSTLSAAAEPNVQPGEWEYTNVTRISTGGQAMPPQRDSHRECVTAEDIANPELFSEDMGDCEITDKTLSRSNMRYSLRCTSEEGMTSTMTMTMQFKGDRVEGLMDGKMTTPMGEMNMQMNIEGKRLGSC